MYLEIALIIFIYCVLGIGITSLLILLWGFDPDNDYDRDWATICIAIWPLIVLAAPVYFSFRGALKLFAYMGEVHKGGR